MSQSFEKETASSTARSLLGALIALGAGFVFMFLGLVAIASRGLDVQTLRSSQALQRRLQADLSNYASGSVSLSKDKRTLRFRSRTEAKGDSEITYQVSEKADEVSRSVGGESQRVARLKNARFENRQGMVGLRWETSEGDATMYWALNRWAR